MLEELQALLSSTHLTIREISADSGVSVSLISAIKAGKRPNPTIETYAALRDCLLKAKRKQPHTAKAA